MVWLLGARSQTADDRSASAYLRPAMRCLSIACRSVNSCCSSSVFVFGIVFMFSSCFEFELVLLFVSVLVL